MQGQSGEKEKEKEGSVTKMLRGPYSLSGSAQQAVIKLHYQTDKDIVMKHGKKGSRFTLLQKRDYGNGRGHL